MRRARQAIRLLGQALTYLGIAIALFIVGILIHEAGHGAMAVAMGARVTRLEVLGVTLWPTLHVSPMDGYWGRIWWRGRLSPTQRAWVAIGGNLATMSVSFCALLLCAVLGERVRRFHIRVRTVLLVLGLFFLDTLTHTLPTFGLPMYLLFGRRDPETVSEAYLAATTLGCPGPLFQWAVVIYGLLATASTLLMCFRRHRE